ncbi:MAG: hypothetical protein ACU0DK_04030 [Pseudooceanicola sp.]
MTRTVTTTAIYPEPPDAVFARARDLGDLTRAMTGLAAYEGMPDKLAEQGDRYEVDVTFWRVLRNPGHVIVVERVDPAARVMQSREHNPNVRRWDHTLTVAPHPEGSLWTDRVVIDAGWRTPVVARLCAHVYRHRHRARDGRDIATRIVRGER